MFSVFSNAQNMNSKNKKIEDLMIITGSGDLGVTILNNMIDSFKKNTPEIDESFWNEFKKEFNAKELIDLMIPIYDKYYTESDIDELIKFYKTPIGKKTISNMPLLMQESMKVGQLWGQSIGEKAINRLKEKGMLKN